MRVYDTNLSLVRYNLEKIYRDLDNNALKVSQFHGKDLHCVIDIGMVKDNCEFLKVAKALNPLGIGIVPYECRFQIRIYKDSGYRGFTDITAKNIIYINTNIPTNYIQRVALSGLLRVIKYMYPDIYNYFQRVIEQENDYLSFLNSEVNIQLLKKSQCLLDDYDIESLANFFAFNPDNDKIPYAFFYKINLPNEKVDLPLSQQKYLDMLLDLVLKIRS